MLKSSQLSPELQTYGFKSFVTVGRPGIVSQALDAAKDYYRRFTERRDQRHNSIALLGVPGSGKTRLLAAIANCLLNDGVGVLYFPHVEGFADIKGDLDESKQKLDVMKQVDVLWWDDLYKGREKPTPFQLDCIFDVINYRYLNNKPIMVSSERDVDQLCAVDMGIGSRIYEMCKTHTIILNPYQSPKETVTAKELNFRLIGA